MQEPTMVVSCAPAPATATCPQWRKMRCEAGDVGRPGSGGDHVASYRAQRSRSWREVERRRALGRDEPHQLEVEVGEPLELLRQQAVEDDDAEQLAVDLQGHAGADVGLGAAFGGAGGAAQVDLEALGGAADGSLADPHRRQRVAIDRHGGEGYQTRAVGVGNEDAISSQPIRFAATS